MNDDNGAAAPNAHGSDCAEIILRLFEYVDNEAGPEDRAAIKEHLDECGPCLLEYERDLLLKSLVRRACHGERAPSALRMQVISRITSISVQRSQSS
ncbi:MAG: mycothiol system anti-sigma-R factor [Ornithinimicrobium sp.]